MKTRHRSYDVGPSTSLGAQSQGIGPQDPLIGDQHGWIYNHRREIAAFSFTLIIKIIWRMITKTINAIVRQIRWYLKIADWAFYLGEKLIGFFFGANQEPGAVHPATEFPGRLPPKI
uniref:Uncharacterized protein n=1 Tax=Acrobeloides nanus TaxID=290746 RepID=A0A914EHN5_9BILA